MKWVPIALQTGLRGYENQWDKNHCSWRWWRYICTWPAWYRHPRTHHPRNLVFFLSATGNFSWSWLFHNTRAAPGIHEYKARNQRRRQTMQRHFTSSGPPSQTSAFTTITWAFMKGTFLENSSKYPASQTMKRPKRWYSIWNLRSFPCWNSFPDLDWLIRQDSFLPCGPNVTCPEVFSSLTILISHHHWSYFPKA